MKFEIDYIEKLAKIIGCDAKALQEYLDTAKKNGAYQTEFGMLGKALTAKQKEEIEKLNLPGIEFLDSTDRRYPLGTFASQLVGYAQYSYDDEKISGVMGLESYFDEVLSGSDGEVTYQIDSDGYYLPDTKKYTKTAFLFRHFVGTRATPVPIRKIFERYCRIFSLCYNIPIYIE
mgnify:CR=1 FL=1